MHEGPNLRVLVVDDYPGAALALCTLLRLHHHECRAATRGLDALEVARWFRPQLALVDLGLPDISGYALGSQLRALAGDHELFLAAVSGSGQPTDRRRALAAGFDQYVVKPLDVATANRLVGLASSKLAAHAHAQAH